MTSELCREYARAYRQLAGEAPTEETWALYSQLADLWENVAGEANSDSQALAKEEA